MKNKVDAVYFEESWFEIRCGDEDDGETTRTHDEEEGGGTDASAGDADAERDEISCWCVRVFLCASMRLGALLLNSAPQSHL